MSAISQAVLPEPSAGAQPGQSIVTAAFEQFGRPVYVCSLHYMPVRERRDYRTRIGGGPWTDYALDAVTDPNGRPSVCVILDGFQRRFQGTSDTTGQKRYSNEPWPAKEIAEDIVRAATGTGPAGPEDTLHPAIWISQAPRVPRVDVGTKGQMVYSPEWKGWGTPEFEKQFPEFVRECKAYARRQWGYCELKIAEGDAFNDGPQKNPRNINELHRGAGKYTKANVAEHPWLEGSSYGSQIPCPICGAATSSQHPKCQKCGEIIDHALYERIQARLREKK